MIISEFIYHFVAYRLRNREQEGEHTDCDYFSVREPCVANFRHSSLILTIIPLSPMKRNLLILPGKGVTPLSRRLLVFNQYQVIKHVLSLLANDHAPVRSE